MNLNDIPTPESDAVFGPRVTGMRSEKCRDLERRLAVAREALEVITAAAYGLSFGEDWNDGTHAKTHGYREALLKALPAARKALAQTAPKP